MGDDYLMDSALLVDPDNQGLNENCKCTICHNVFNQPKACGNCLNHFCSRCIGRWQNTHPRECPLCKSYVQLRPVPLLLSILSKLQFRCPHNQNGCEELVGYDAFVIHSKNCQYEQISCRFRKCTTHTLRKDISSHEKQCVHQPAICKWCNSTFELGKLDKHLEGCSERMEKCEKCTVDFRHQQFLDHVEVCPFSELACRWCEQTFLRRELSDHESMCQARRINCTGCRRQMPMNELYQHQNDCEEYPTVCRHCSQIIPRREFAGHTLASCIEFIKNQADQKNLALQRQNELFKQKLKTYRHSQRNLLKMLGQNKPLTFSLFKKDADIFVSGPLAAVREHKKKRKDRYVLLEVDRLQNQPVSWKIKVLTIKSQWFAVGLSEESNLYVMRRYQTFGHCTYLVSANGMLYCTHDQSQNQRQADFRLSCLDEVLCEYLPAQGILRVSNLTKRKTATITISLEQIQSKSYYPCVCLRCGGESAELMKERGGYGSEESRQAQLSSDIDSV